MLWRRTCLFLLFCLYFLADCGAKNIGYRNRLLPVLSFTFSLLPSHPPPLDFPQTIRWERLAWPCFNCYLPLKGLAATVPRCLHEAALEAVAGYLLRVGVKVPDVPELVARQVKSTSQTVDRNGQCAKSMSGCQP